MDEIKEPQHRRDPLTLKKYPKNNLANVPWRGPYLPLIRNKSENLAPNSDG